MKNVVEMNYNQIHEFVNNNKKIGFFWEGYTVVKWSPGHNGYTEVNGMFRNGKWGYANRYNLTDKGMWLIPAKYVKHT
jgi:hypothetical protein